MTARKKLVLHIGSHKTATTFIQGSLAKNKRLLNDMGILYPKAGQIYDAHFRLCWDIKAPENAETALTDIPVWQDLIKEIEDSPAHTAVVSSEEFGLSISPSRLEPLSELFDVQVIYYLRSPDSHLESFYNQFVKDFGTRETRTINEYLAEERLGFLNTRIILEPWMNVFGEQSISLRIFSKPSLPNGILADFFETIGVLTYPEFKAPDVSVLHKVSLPPDALEYLRFANSTLTKEHGHHPFVVRLVQMANVYGDELRSTRAGILSFKSRETLRHRFSSPNTWVAKRLLGMTTTPFPASETPEPPADFSDRPEIADARILGRVAAMMQNYSDTDD